MLSSVRFAVGFTDLFPYGFFVQSVEPVNEFDDSRRPGDAPRQETDKDSGLPLWAVLGIDGDPEAARRRQSEVKIKIAAPVAPELPAPTPGFPFPAVEFAGLTVTPYLDRSRCRAGGNCRGRVAYSFRASAMRPAPRSGSGRSGGSGSATSPAA